MSFTSEFKTFIMRGNVIDLAVGVIIGAAFGAIVNSFVNDIIMPPIGLVTGRAINFKDLFLSLDSRHFETLEEARKASAPIIAYGNFINTIINFLIIALVVFLFIRQVNRLFPPPPPAPVPGPSGEERLLTEIRDLLARRP